MCVCLSAGCVRPSSHSPLAHSSVLSSLSPSFLPPQLLSASSCSCLSPHPLSFLPLWESLSPPPPPRKNSSFPSPPTGLSRPYPPPPPPPPAHAHGRDGGSAGKRTDGKPALLRSQGGGGNTQSTHSLGRTSAAAMWRKLSERGGAKRGEGAYSSFCGVGRRLLPTPTIVIMQFPPRLIPVAPPHSFFPILLFLLSRPLCPPLRPMLPVRERKGESREKEMGKHRRKSIIKLHMRDTMINQAILFAPHESHFPEEPRPTHKMALQKMGLFYPSPHPFCVASHSVVQQYQ